MVELGVKMVELLKMLSARFPQTLPELSGGLWGDLSTPSCCSDGAASADSGFGSMPWRPTATMTWGCGTQDRVTRLATFVAAESKGMRIGGQKGGVFVKEEQFQCDANGERAKAFGGM